MFALPILSHVLKALFLYQNSPKMKLFLQKNAEPQNSPPIANFWLRACLCSSCLKIFYFSVLAAKISNFGGFNWSRPPNMASTNFVRFHRSFISSTDY